MQRHSLRVIGGRTFTVPQGNALYALGVRASIPLIDRALAFARVDWAPQHRQPTAMRLVIGAVIAIAGSLAADAILVAVCTRVFPATAGYEHFRFNDYAKLTIIGVMVGCVGWPVLTRVSSAPRWLYARLTVLITLALFLPDAWILVKGQPLREVVVLMAMHVAVALVIYFVMVNIAPVSGQHPQRPTRRLVFDADAIVSMPEDQPATDGPRRFMSA